MQKKNRIYLTIKNKKVLTRERERVDILKVIYFQYMKYPDSHVITPVGMIASGKDFIADMIWKKFWIPKTTVSDILRKKVQEEWGNIGDRQTLIDMSKKLTQENNGDGSILARMTIEEAEDQWTRELQIVGMRQSPQMIYLMKNTGRLTSVFLHTHNEIRYARYCTSKSFRGEPFLTYDQFISSEIDQNTGDNNDLYNLAALCRYHWLPDGSVIDTWVKVEIPDTMPRYDRFEHTALLSQNPDALRELLWWEMIITPIEYLKTPQTQKAMNEKVLTDSRLAEDMNNKTRTTIQLVLWHSHIWYDYLEGYGRTRQDA